MSSFRLSGGFQTDERSCIKKKMRSLLQKKENAGPSLFFILLSFLIYGKALGCESNDFILARDLDGVEVQITQEASVESVLRAIGAVYNIEVIVEGDLGCVGQTHFKMHDAGEAVQYLLRNHRINIVVRYDSGSYKRLRVRKIVAQAAGVAPSELLQSREMFRQLQRLDVPPPPPLPSVVR